MQGYGFPPYLDGFHLSELMAHLALAFEFGCKIFSSKYFKRAFGGQEFRVAWRCYFLILCERKNYLATLNFCILDDSFVSMVVKSLLSLFLKGKLQAVEFSEQYGGMGTIIAPLSRLQGILLRKAYRNLAEIPAVQKFDITTLAVNTQGALRADFLCQTFDNIFGMEAGGDQRTSDPDERARASRCEQGQAEARAQQCRASPVPKR